MKYLKQFVIILLISFIGEILHTVLPLPIPASIYGIVLMFMGLLLYIIPLDSVKETAKFLIEVMPLTFIPAAVGIISGVFTSIGAMSSLSIVVAGIITVILAPVFAGVL